MSKRDKIGFEAAGTGQDYPELDSHAGLESPAAEHPEKPESRHFNTWLDRALPLLQQQLAGLEIISVTAPPDKAKH